MEKPPKKRRLIDNPDFREFFYLSLLFFTGRLIFMAVGIRFDISPLYYFIQYPDLDLLTTKLLVTVWHLHIQPPLFPLFTGIILKLFPSYFVAVFSAIYLVIGLAIVLSLNRSLKNIGMARFWRIYVPLLFSLCPSVILTENWFFYSYPVLGLLSLSALALTRRDIDGEPKPNWPLFFGLISLLTLSRSLFHLIFILGLGLLFLLKGHKRAFIPALIGLIVISGLYAKNQALFGFFGSSSWLGMSLAKMTVWHIPEDTKAEYISRGILSGYAGETPFAELKDYGRTEDPKTGIEVLDRLYGLDGLINHNNYNYLEISRTLMGDVLQTLRRHPGIYLKRVAFAYFVYFTPMSDNGFLAENRMKISLYDRLWNRIIYGQYLSSRYLSEPKEVTIGDAPGTAIYYIRFHLLLFSLLAIGLSIHALVRSRNPLILFSAFVILYIMFFGNILEVGENNRFRFLSMPAMLTVILHYSARIPVIRRLFFY